MYHVVRQILATRHYTPSHTLPQPQATRHYTLKPYSKHTTTPQGEHHYTPRHIPLHPQATYHYTPRHTSLHPKAHTTTLSRHTSLHPKPHTTTPQGTKVRWHVFMAHGVAIHQRQNMVQLLRGCQTIDKVGRFCLPIKSANEDLSSVMQKSADFVGR